MLFPIKIRSINGGKTLGGAPRFFTSKGPQSKFTSAWIAVPSTEQAFLLTPSWLGVCVGAKEHQNPVLHYHTQY